MRIKNWIKKHGRNTFSLLLGLFAVVCLAIPYVQTFIISNNQVVAIEKFNELTVDDIRNNVEETQEDVTFDYSQVPSLTPEDVTKQALSGIKAYHLGLISIPDLDMLLPIYKGISNEILFYGAGTLKPDQRMGENNYVLASHNYEYEPKLLFTPLLRSQVGMKVYLTDKDKVYIYQISEIKKVNPEDVWVVDDRGKNELTLITCDDIYGSHRFIYSCDLVEIKTVDEVGPDEMTRLFNHTISNIEARGVL